MTKHGTCNWCNSLIENAPDTYDNRIQRLYCSPTCYWLDWMFRKWQNDQYLTWQAKQFMEDRNGKNP